MYKRQTLIEARQIIEDDDDYDESGELKESVKEEYEEKYGDMDYLTITEGDTDTGSDDEEEPADDEEEEGGDDEE